MSETKFTKGQREAMREAAPEMRKALVEMLEAFSMNNIGVNASLRRTSAKRAARAALIKARGEEVA